MNAINFTSGLCALGFCGVLISSQRSEASESAALSLPAAEIDRVVVDIGNNNARVISTHEKNASLVMSKQRWAATCRVESVFDGETWSVKVRDPACVADFEFRVAPTTSIRHIGGTGAFSLAGVSGDLRITTSSGAIKVSTMARAVHLSSQNGDIDLTMVSDFGYKPMVSVSTGNGAVRIQAQSVQSAAMFVHTDSGNARIELPQTASLDLRHEDEDSPSSMEIAPRDDGRFLLRSCGNIDVLLRAG